jgi:hypothetical protein
MIAYIEEQAPDEGAGIKSDDDFGWIAVNDRDATPLARTIQNGVGTWTGDVNLKGLTHPFRLVIREAELFTADPAPLTQSSMFGRRPGFLVLPGTRIVYAATFSVS